MADRISIGKNLQFWHRYPELLLTDLTPEQLHWQPEHHDTSIIFALWPASRAEDDLVLGFVGRRPTVFASQNWMARLPVSETGISPFGNGLTREQIGRIRLDPAEVMAYARAVGDGVASYLASLTDEEVAEEVALPFFRGVYEGVDAVPRGEAIAFFSIGHVTEHLGEVQFLRGLVGLKGAPL
jgi:hypothetical protein